MMMPKYGDARSDIDLETAVIGNRGSEGLTITTAVRLTAMTVGFCLVIAQVALDLMLVFHAGEHAVTLLDATNTTKRDSGFSGAQQV
jgi:hypothetical protein